MPPRDQTSPYLNLLIWEDDDGNKGFDFRHSLERDDFVGAKYVIVQVSDTLHHLAWRFYGDQRWWWVLFDYNDIIDPTEELVVGSEILVPPLSEVVAQIRVAS